MTTTKPLRVAGLIRVSTERQKVRGESLATQDQQIRQTVGMLGGELVGVYGGQEHGTAGWERKQLDKMLDDARKPRRPFDAVMVCDTSRWSRDNVRSETGLDLLRDAGVKFYVLGSEYNLFDPQQRGLLAVSVVFGSMQAATQRQKSLLNRIARAQKGVPTARLPFGRTYDRVAKAWGVDAAKQAMIADVARRYLAGESLPALAREHRYNHSGLCRILRQDCGDSWAITFNAPKLNIREKVTLAVPRLLDVATEKAVKRRLEANRSYLHRPPAAAEGRGPLREYLLGGHVFCGGCGYALIGEHLKGRRYYRHPKGRERPCPLTPPPWVPADGLEGRVLTALMDMHSDPFAIVQAVRAAAPDNGKVLDTKKKLEDDLARVRKGRDRVLGLVAKDVITDEQAEKQLGDLAGQEKALGDQLERLEDELGEPPPDLTGLERYLWGDGCDYEELRKLIPAGLDDKAAKDQLLARHLLDNKRLVKAVFGGPVPVGHPLGVYVTPAGEARRFRGREYKFVMRGTFVQLIEAAGNAGDSSPRVPRTNDSNSPPHPKRTIPFRLVG